VFSALLKHLKQHAALWIILAATLIVYLKSLFFPSISWDDPEMVFRNADVKHFNLFSFFSKHYVGNYIPLTMLTHAINWMLFKNSAVGHHTINLLFHLLNGYLVYRLSHLLFKHNSIATISTAIFLLHPLQTESVNWIGELKNLGYVTFFLSGLIYYYHSVTTKQVKYILFYTLSFIVACLFKPSAVVFPLALLCIDLHVHQQFKAVFLLNKIPLLFVSLLFGIINLKTQAADQFINYAHQFPLHERFINAGFAIFNYLKLFLFPYPQSIIYPFPEFELYSIIAGSFVILALAYALYSWYKKKEFTLFAIVLFFLLNLILVLQFIPFGEVLYADRYMYLPMLGLAWLAGLLLSKIRLRYSAIVLVFVLGTLTFLRSNTWQNSISLYEDIIRKYPNNFLALNSLGVEYMMKGNHDKALEYFNKATNIAPYNYKGFYNRALLHLKNNNPKRAIEDLNKVLSMYDYNKAYVARASAYYALMDYEKARSDAKMLVYKEPKNSKAYFVLGNCANDQNDLQNAMDFYNRAIELDFENPDFHFKRAIVYGKKQDFNNCLLDLETTLTLKPDYIEAFYWRGVAKVNLKQNPCDDFKLAAENNYAPAYEAYNKFCRN
jgi:protein O-mannosyl-transferase